MIGFHLAMFVLPAAIIALAIVLARVTRLRPAPDTQNRRQGD